MSKSVEMDHRKLRNEFFVWNNFIGSPKDQNQVVMCIFAEGGRQEPNRNWCWCVRIRLYVVIVLESNTIERIIRTTFSVKVKKITTFGKYKAEIPEVKGTAFLTGKNSFWINPDDPLQNGFIFR